MDGLLHKDHRKRLKNRFLQNGLEDFEPHNMLELLLFFGVPQKDTNELAHRLIDRFGSFNRVLDAPYEELLKVDGVGENVATLIKLITPLFRYYHKNIDIKDEPLDTPSRVGGYLTQCYAGFTEEVVSVLALDSLCHIISFDIIGKGDISSAGIRYRSILEIVMRTNAPSVVICHNHPGGLAIPSRQDIIATEKIRDLLGTINVALVDHIVIAGDDFVSLAESREFCYLFRPMKNKAVPPPRES